MPINASPEYYKAEKIYLAAQSIDEKIKALEALIKVAPKHKSSENLLKELRTRLKRFEEKKDKASKTGKSTKKAIKKENFQCAIIGLPNSGKSSVLKAITNATPLITEHPFSTYQPQIGTLDYQGIKAQIIDLPSIGSENFDKSIVNTADMLLIVITKLNEIEKISPYIEKASGKKLYLFNKCDTLSPEQLRKLEATIKSKKIPAIIISTITKNNLETLKTKILENMNVIRVYTKEPGKPPSKQPMVLPISSTVKEIAEKILKGFSKKIKTTKITGPSSKFPNQIVGLSHICKDKDIIEFHTR